MAVDLSKLAVRRSITLDELSGKIVAIDAYNVLYQFLATIRQQDGTLLMDSEGNVTSHLSGLFYRTIDMVTHGIRPIYVFDGLPSVLKKKALEARLKRREEAYSAWQDAVRRGDMGLARTKAQASTAVNKEIVGSAKELLRLMGVYIVNAPSEGEAQASEMCRKGVVDVVGSQDYDTLLLGAPLIARNMTISGRRKLPGKDVYIEVRPELIDLRETLEKLQISQQQLVWIGLMLGTDFNDGINGIGPVGALKIARSAKSLSDIEAVVRTKYKSEFEIDPGEITEMFERPEVDEIRKEDVNSGLELKPDMRGIIEFMCSRRGFSEGRIVKYAQRLVSLRGEARQRGMGAWIG